MQDQTVKAYFDQGITGALALLVLFFLILLVRKAPEIVDAWHKMTNALDRQNEVTESNSKLILESKETHRRLDADIAEEKREREKVSKTIRELEKEVESLKAEIKTATSAMASKADIDKLEKKMDKILDLVGELRPFSENTARNVGK